MPRNSLNACTEILERFESFRRTPNSERLRSFHLITNTTHTDVWNHRFRHSPHMNTSFFSDLRFISTCWAIGLRRPLIQYKSTYLRRSNASNLCLWSQHVALTTLSPTTWIVFTLSKLILVSIQVYMSKKKQTTGLAFMISARWIENIVANHLDRLHSSKADTCSIILRWVDQNVINY